MRISDWSSDVCSSDLTAAAERASAACRFQRPCFVAHPRAAPADPGRHGSDPPTQENEDAIHGDGEADRGIGSRRDAQPGIDRKITRLNSSTYSAPRMQSPA